MSERVKKMAVSFGLPRIIILSFLLVLIILLPILGLQIDMLADQALTRIGMNGILVLAMVPAIESGVKMNFALPLGIVCGLLGGALSLEFGINGAAGFLTAILIAVPLAVLVGYLYGKVLNRIKGSEMMIATYVGFSAVSLMCIGWLVLPVKNPEIRWPQGHGLRTMTVLSGKYEKILDNFLAIRITDELSIPTGLFLFFFLACLLVWLFSRSHLGIMMKAGGANPSFAKATGIDVDRTRILGMILSTVLGAVGIIVYAQSYGFYQYYNAPLMMAFSAVASVLIGGASGSHATIFHAVLGVVMFQAILTFTLPIANVIVPDGNLSEIVRIIVSNGIILYALTKAGGNR